MKVFFQKDILSIIVATILLFIIKDIRFFILFVFIDFTYRFYIFADIHFKFQEKILENTEKE